MSPHRLVIFAVLALAGLILLAIGTVFVFVGSRDYTDHTGRAEAVVVERDVDRRSSSSRNNRTDVDIYVSYRAEDGTEVEHAQLGGLNPSDYGEGESLEVAYHPDEPGRPVTVQSTEAGALRPFQLLGALLAVVGAALSATAGILLWRRRS